MRDRMTGRMMNKQTDGWIDRQMDDGQTDGWIDRNDAMNTEVCEVM